MTRSRWSAAVAVGATVAFMAAAERGLTGGDAGELIVVAQRLGVAHPPGYPLFILLGHVMTWLPVPPALALNLFSALCGGVACGLLTFVAFALGARPSIALAVGVLGATSALWWEWSTRAEVFALNAALCLGVLALALRAWESPSTVRRIAVAFLGGLALTNHQAALFVVLPVSMALAAWSSWRERAFGAIAFVVGLLPYAALPALYWHASLDSWGAPVSLGEWLSVVLRRDYGTFSLAPDGVAVPIHARGLLFAVRTLAFELRWIGVPIAVLGWLQLWRSQRRPLAIALAVALVLSLPVFFLASRLPAESALFQSVLSRFVWLPSIIALVLVAPGAERIANAWRGPSHLVALAVVCLCAVQAGHRVATRTPVVLIEPFAAEVLRRLPPGALVLVRGDLFSNALRHAQSTGLRPDVSVLDQELLTYFWYARSHAGHASMPGFAWHPARTKHFTIRELVEANADRPIFTLGGLKPGDTSLDGLGRWAPRGLVERWVPALDAAQLVENEQAASALMASDLGHQALTGPRSDVWEQAVVDEAWEALNRVAVASLPNDHSPETAARIAALLERVVARPGGAPAEHWRNLAIATARLERPTELRRAIEGYLQRAPAGAADRAIFEQELRRLPP